jgi:hypothetical protein
MALVRSKKVAVSAMILAILLMRPAQAQEVKVKIHITVNEDRVLTATMADNQTARDFLSLLPLTVKMDDLFGREKYGHLPKPLSNKSDRSDTYEIGQIAYWSPGPDIAIYYHQDGDKIPSPGIIVVGRIDSGVEALKVPGSVNVKIELVK